MGLVMLSSSKGSAFVGLNNVNGTFSALFHASFPTKLPSFSMVLRIRDSS